MGAPLYVYGFMRGRDSPPALGAGVGEPPGAVCAVAQGGLAALASPVPDGEGRIAPRRANLLAHSEVLSRALEHGPVVPLRFGTVMPDEESLRGELAGRAERLEAMLEALDGRVEMGVSAQYREDVVLREVLSESPAVAAARRRVTGRDEAAAHFARIHLGELVAGAVEAKRAADAQAVARELEPIAVAASHGRPLTDWGVLNSAYLVERGRLGEFDAAVEHASRARAARMRFKLLGPLPPHSFVGAV